MILVLKVENAELQTTVYNKTDDFPFKVVRYGFADSNVHKNQGLAIFYSQLIRFVRISNTLSDFENKASCMFQEFLEHGFDRNALIAKFLCFAVRHKVSLVNIGLFSDAEIVSSSYRMFHV